MDTANPSENDLVRNQVDWLLEESNLSVDAQVKRLQHAGITGNANSIRQVLSRHSNYYRIVPTLLLFPVHTEGSLRGLFVRTSITDMLRVQEADAVLSRAFLNITLFCEREVRFIIMHSLEEHHEEDGLSIVSDYLASMKPSFRKIRIAELRKIVPQDPLVRGTAELDSAIRLPAWAFLENLSFGALNDFCHYLSVRWNEKAFQQLFLSMRFAASLRNSCAHQRPILPCCMLPVASYRSGNLKKQLRDRGMSKRMVSRWTGNRFVQQIAGTTLAFDDFSKASGYGACFQELMEATSILMSLMAKYGAGNTHIRGLAGFLVSLFKTVRKMERG